MKEPFFTSSGDTYEYKAIAEWFERGHRTNPLTNEVLADRRLTPNKTLKSLIEEWKSRKSPGKELSPTTLKKRRRKSAVSETKSSVSKRRRRRRAGREQHESSIPTHDDHTPTSIVRRMDTPLSRSSLFAGKHERKQSKIEKIVPVPQSLLPASTSSSSSELFSKIHNATGCELVVLPEDRDHDHPGRRRIRITGLPENVEDAEVELVALSAAEQVREKARQSREPQNCRQTRTVIQVAGFLIGFLANNRMQSISHDTGCKLDILPEDDEPRQDFRSIVLIGSPQQIEAAEARIHTLYSNVRYLRVPNNVIDVLDPATIEAICYRTGAHISIREADGAGNTVVAVWGEEEEVTEATSEIDELLLDESAEQSQRMMEMARQMMRRQHAAFEDLILRPMGAGIGMGFGISMGMRALALPPMELGIPMGLGGPGEMVMGFGRPQLRPPVQGMAPQPGQFFPPFPNF
eukprot:CAMPEP_0170192870 /NCGR_PEP_ID=MMETSP0040_2-20121228/55440_1 /TAXON_ID=641309 /ORGANISM="Lotharella oceanica, Strain CCMP622" /LENGTH=462 /DNA_ID=CAMNT_0010441343 /DNA_START=9 /DNA_END=1397 /DNA_ORIENTATION=+